MLIRSQLIPYSLVRCRLHIRGTGTYTHIKKFILLCFALHSTFLHFLSESFKVLMSFQDVHIEFERIVCIMNCSYVEGVRCSVFLSLFIQILCFFRVCAYFVEIGWKNINLIVLGEDLNWLSVVHCVRWRYMFCGRCNIFETSILPTNYCFCWLLELSNTKRGHNHWKNFYFHSYSS